MSVNRMLSKKEEQRSFSNGPLRDRWEQRAQSMADQCKQEAEWREKSALKGLYSKWTYHWSLGSNGDMSDFSKLTCRKDEDNNKSKIKFKVVPPPPKPKPEPPPPPPPPRRKASPKPRRPKRKVEVDVFRLCWKESWMSLKPPKYLYLKTRELKNTISEFAAIELTDTGKYKAKRCNSEAELPSPQDKWILSRKQVKSPAQVKPYDGRPFQWDILFERKLVWEADIEKYSLPVWAGTWKIMNFAFRQQKHKWDRIWPENFIKKPERFQHLETQEELTDWECSWKLSGSELECETIPDNETLNAASSSSTVTVTIDVFRPDWSNSWLLSAAPPEEDQERRHNWFCSWGFRQQIRWRKASLKSHHQHSKMLTQRRKTTSLFLMSQLDDEIPDVMEWMEAWITPKRSAEIEMDEQQDEEEEKEEEQVKTEQEEDKDEVDSMVNTETYDEEEEKDEGVDEEDEGEEKDEEVEEAEEEEEEEEENEDKKEREGGLQNKKEDVDIRQLDMDKEYDEDKDEEDEGVDEEEEGEEEEDADVEKEKKKDEEDSEQKDKEKDIAEEDEEEEENDQDEEEDDENDQDEEEDDENDQDEEDIADEDRNIIHIKEEEEEEEENDQEEDSEQKDEEEDIEVDEEEEEEEAGDNEAEKKVNSRNESCEEEEEEEDDKQSDVDETDEGEDEELNVEVKNNAGDREEHDQDVEEEEEEEEEGEEDEENVKVDDEVNQSVERKTKKNKQRQVKDTPLHLQFHKLNATFSSWRRSWMVAVAHRGGQGNRGEEDDEEEQRDWWAWKESWRICRWKKPDEDEVVCFSTRQRFQRRVGLTHRADAVLRSGWADSWKMKAAVREEEEEDEEEEDEEEEDEEEDTS